MVKDAARDTPSLPSFPLAAATGTMQARRQYHPVSDIELFIEANGRLGARAKDPSLQTVHLNKALLKFTTPEGWHVTATCYGTRLTGFGETTYACTLVEARRGTLRKGNTVRNYDFITNLHFEPTWTKPPSGGWVKFNASALSDLSLHMYQDDYGQGLTGYFSWESIYDSQHRWADQRMDHLFNLLSFASGNTVSFPVRCIVGENGSAVRIQQFSDDTGRGQSPLGIGPIKVRYYLDKTYDRYVRFHKDLHLPMVIHWFVLMQNANYADDQYLLGCIVLETMKTAYATYKGYPIKGHYFYKDSTYKQRLYFRDILQQLYAEFKVRGGDLDFIDYRNNVIHGGRTLIPLRQIGRRLRYLNLTVNVLMFKILGYDLLHYYLGTYRVR